MNAFQYDAQRDGFTCPAGQFLQRWNREEPRRRTRYRAPAGICARCPLKSQCSDAKRGRLLSRYDLQEHIDWADGCGSRGLRRRLMERRKIRAEGSFADAANNHGYKRARWRGLGKVELQNVLIATIQNLRKLVRALHAGPKAPAAAKRLIPGLLIVLRLLRETPVRFPCDLQRPTSIFC
jgi:hypothetical protein